MRLLTTGVMGILSIIMFSLHSYSQTTITSTNGWTATITITPTGVVPSTANCQWSYNYDIQYNIKVVFAGSSNSRQLNFNTYFNCTGGNGGTPYRGSTLYTANYNGVLATNNTSRGYSSVSSYNYGSNPSCTSITLNHTNCTTVRLDYWGPGTGGSITVPVSSATPLPIELMNFDAEANNQQVDLKWSTASERDNDYFTIEKTTDGINYETVGEVDGAGNSSQKRDYTFTDYAPSAGISYYRLKQTDYNGKTEYFDVRSVEIAKTEVITNVYPSPTTNSHINVLVAQTKSPVQINLYTIMGQLVSTQTIDPTSGNVTQEIELPENGNTFLVELTQDNVLIGRHKILSARQ